MNRNLLFVYVCTLGLCFSGLSQSNVVKMSEDAQKIQSLLGKVSDFTVVEGLWKVELIPDNYLFIRDYCPELEELELLCAQHWQVIVDNLDEIADSDIKKDILLSACTRWLKPKPFVEFLEAVLSLIEQGELDRYYFKSVQMPPDESSEGWLLLATRATIDPQVRRVVERARLLFLDQEHMVKSYDDDLSGRSFRDLQPIRYFLHTHKKCLIQITSGVLLLLLCGSSYLFYKRLRLKSKSED